jgi:hypothetical protein
MIARRIRSWLWDYLVVLGLLGAAFLLIGLPSLLGWLHLGWMQENVVLSDIVIALVTVIPFLAYLVATEAGHGHATWGKGREQLAVFDLDHASPRPSAVVLRNTIKLLPWQFGHMGAILIAADQEPSLPAVLFPVVSLVLLVAAAGPSLLGRRGVHDLVAGTQVLVAGSDLT